MKWIQVRMVPSFQCCDCHDALNAVLEGNHVILTHFPFPGTECVLKGRRYRMALAVIPTVMVEDIGEYGPRPASA